MDQSLYQKHRRHRRLVCGGCRALLTLCSLALIAGVAAEPPPELDPWTKSFQGLRNAQQHHLNHTTPENNASLIVVVDQKRRLQSVLVTNRDPSNQFFDTSDNNAKRKRKQKNANKSTTTSTPPENNEIFDLPPTYQLRHQPTKQIHLVVRPTQLDYNQNQRPVAGGGGGGGRKPCTPCKVIPHRSQRPFYQPTSLPFYISSSSVASSSSSASSSVQIRQRGNLINMLNVYVFKL